MSNNITAARYESFVQSQGVLRFSSFACGHSPSSNARSHNFIFVLLFILLFIDVKQLVLPFLTSLIAMLPGVATSFFGKSNLVMVETESYSGVTVVTVSNCRPLDFVSKNLHSVASLSLQKETVDSVKDTLESSVGGPVAIKDTVADAAMAIDVGVEERGNETTFGWESREVLGHLEVHQESTVLVWSLRRLSNHVSLLSQIGIMVQKNSHPP